MNTHRKQFSLPSLNLPAIQERKSSRQQPISDPLSRSPEIKKFEAFLLESITKRQKISQKFYLFQPLQ